MTDLVLLNIHDGIGTITLNRPDKRNALSLAMLQQINRTLQTVGHAEDLHLLLLIANGPAFCSGMDLREHELLEPETARAFAQTLAETYKHLLTSPLPLLCAVDGPVMGGGTGIALACDMIWMHEHARIGFPEVRIGLIPALASVVARHRISHGKLLHMAIGGEWIDAAHAERMGLIDFVSTSSAAEDARSHAEILRKHNAPAAMKHARRFLTRTAISQLDQELDAAIRMFCRTAASSEAAWGIRSFRDRKPLDWTTRQS